MRKEEKQVFRGIKVWRNQEPRALVVRFHASSDPNKSEHTEAGRLWIAEQKAKAVSPEWFEQEVNIDFGARSGARIYHAYNDDDTQLFDLSEMPREGTKYFVLDPHPGTRTPHAFIWALVDRDSNIWVYRELWPSRSYGLNKNVPEDDDIWSIRQYCETIQWLESKKNPENDGDEKIFKRIIDYAARGFGKDADNPDVLNYQERYEQYSAEIGHPLYFDDCIKDNEAGYAEVNELLKPKPFLNAQGEVVRRSKLRIARHLVEARFELRNCRHKMLQPHQVDTMDPLIKAIQKRNHIADCIKYLCMAKPVYVDRNKRIRNTWQPAFEGLSY